ncbi:site-specific DNA-methyltransferase [Sphingobacterium multivorum]|uniref:site-specific DNA-methyltransferase n=1 Tax=Sphingobacterium multivorum TaxID=28454 RepID=UPI00369B9E28
MDGKSLNITEDLISKLKEIIPGAFTEDKINVEQLKQILGESINTDSERYQLNWAGKTDAYKLLQVPTTSTLKPFIKESTKWNNAEHILIEGENLETLKVLQKSYYGQINAIYIDPPYNTGSDNFIYPDKFTESKEEYLLRLGEKDEEGYMTKEGLFRPNRKENGQFHSNWLSMMLPRLFLGRNLLHEDGLIFVSIDDNELSSLKLLMDEIFGEENFRNIILVRRYDKNINTQFLSEGLKSFNTGAEYVLIYSKSASTRMNPVFREASEKRKSEGYWKGFWNDAERKTMQYELLGVSIEKGQWKWKEDVAQEAVKNYQEYEEKFASKMSLEEYWQSTGSNKKFIRRKPEGKGLNQGVEHWIAPNDKILRNTLWQDIFASKSPQGFEIPFNNPKNPDLIKLLLEIAFGDSTEGTVLDFFAGSGSTAHAVLEYNEEKDANLRFISIQLPEQIDAKEEAYQKGHRVISDITRTRIKDVIKSIEEKRQGALNFNQNTTSLGFRFFKLSDSNFRIWRSDLIKSEQDLVNQTKLFQDQHTEAKESINNILWELSIKNGIGLTETINEIVVSSTTIFHIPARKLVFVLESFSKEVQQKIIELKPRHVICLDRLFKGEDSLKTNTILKLEQEGISFQSI